MSIERADFLRRLPEAVGGEVLPSGRDSYRGADGRWSVEIADLPDLTIGLLRLARLSVKITLYGMDDAAANAFHARFDTYYQRGGG